MMVIRMAITPSLKASSRSFVMWRVSGGIDGARPGAGNGPGPRSFTARRAWRRAPAAALAGVAEAGEAAPPARLEAGGVVAGVAGVAAGDVVGEAAPVVRAGAALVPGDRGEAVRVARGARGRVALGVGPLDAEHRTGQRRPVCGAERLHVQLFEVEPELAHGRLPSVG